MHLVFGLNRWNIFKLMFKLREKLFFYYQINTHPLQTLQLQEPTDPSIQLLASTLAFWRCDLGLDSKYKLWTEIIQCSTPFNKGTFCTSRKVPLESTDWALFKEPLWLTPCPWQISARQTLRLTPIGKVWLRTKRIIEYNIEKILLHMKIFMLV